jgi:hypothetical protein
MWRSQTQQDSRLEVERRHTFKGSARISLDVLSFQPRKHRDIDRKHIEYLKRCFRQDECRRLEVRNHVEAEIDQQMLDNILHDCRVTAQELLTNRPNGYPWLSFPEGFQLECLHGQHRIQAAREFLLPTDKWWTVDLYTSGKYIHLLPRWGADQSRTSPRILKRASMSSIPMKTHQAMARHIVRYATITSKVIPSPSYDGRLAFGGSG